MKVLKRDGSYVDWESYKIMNALTKCSENTEGEDLTLSDIVGIAKEIENNFKDKDHKHVSVEEIQDAVETALMDRKKFLLAKSYILYRDERTKVRERNSDLMKKVRSKLFCLDVENQNANVDEYSFGGRMGAVNSEVLKQFALDNCMSDMARENHLNNRIYIHDLDHYSAGDHNCLSVPLDSLLANGFKVRQTDIRPANSVSTAFQLVAVLFQIQSLQQFGGVSATHLDHTLVPYVRKSFFKHFKDGLKFIALIENFEEDWSDKSIEAWEYWAPSMELMEKYNTYDLIWKRVYKYAMEMTEKEVYQGAEALYHNLNSLQSRSGKLIAPLY